MVEQRRSIYGFTLLFAGLMLAMPATGGAAAQQGRPPSPLPLSPMLSGTPRLPLSSERPAPAMPAAWAEAATVPLWPEGTPSGGYAPRTGVGTPPPIFVRNIDKPRLHVFRPATPNGAAILVMPGGAYDFVSIANEGLAVAQDFTARGYTVFVLLYRLPGEGWKDRADVPLQDAQRAMRIIRSEAKRYQVDPALVAAIGFSAGGHLAATLATDYAQSVYSPRDAIDRLDAKPAAVGLIYPVIEAEPPYTHRMSAERLLGEAPTPEAIARRSPARRVTIATPPIFLLHALDDGAVPPENSLAMLAAMRRIGRPVEAHFTEEGGHGFGLGSPAAPAGHWSSMFDLWLRRYLGMPAPTLAP